MTHSQHNTVTRSEVKMYSETFEKITPDHWDNLKALLLRETGVKIDADSGKASRDGLTISWDYSNVHNYLAVACLERPWFCSDGMIKGKVDELISASYPPIPKVN